MKFGKYNRISVKLNLMSIDKLEILKFKTLELFTAPAF